MRRLQDARLPKPLTATDLWAAAVLSGIEKHPELPGSKRKWPMLFSRNEPQVMARVAVAARVSPRPPGYPPLTDADEEAAMARARAANVAAGYPADGWSGDVWPPLPEPAPSELPPPDLEELRLALSAGQVVEPASTLAAAIEGTAERRKESGNR